MATVTAQRILDENGWSATDDISLTNLEYLIDNAINYINLMAGTSISNLSGTAGSKTVTVTSAQDPIIKSAVALCVRAYVEKGPGVGIASVSLQQIISDPHYKIHTMFMKQGIMRLRGRSFTRA